MIAARSSNDIARQAGAASVAALIAASASRVRGSLHGAEHVLVVVRLDDVDLRAAAGALAAADVRAEADLAPLLAAASSASSSSRSGLPGA